MKAIVIKATGAKVQFAKSAAKTKAALEAVGVTIGLSTVKLLQNGSKTAACGVEVVEIKEKAKTVRKSAMFAQMLVKFPELAEVQDKGFKPFAVEMKHHTRVGFKNDDGKRLFLNIGKKGVTVRDLNKDEKSTMFASMQDAVKFIVG